MQSKNNLRKENNRWEKLIEHLPVMIFESNLKNELTFTSKSVYAILGYRPEEMTGRYAVDFFHPDDRERLLGNIRKKLEGTLQENTKYRLRKKSGEYITATFRSSPILQNGKPVGIIGVAIDISETAKLEKELADSEARYRSLFSHSPLGIYRSTPDGRIIVANAALANMMGYGSPEELQKMNLEEKNQQSGFGRALLKKKLEAEGEITALESMWTRKDGTYIWVRENAILIKDVQGKPLYYDGIVEDITFRKNAELLLRRQRDLLNIAQQMAHMGSWEEDLLSGTVLWSREEYRIFELPEGTPASEKLFFSFVHPEDRHLLKKRMILLNCDAGEVEAEYRIRVNGKEKWIRSIMTSHCDHNGKVVRLYGMDMDITKEKKQHLRLEKESQLLKKTQELGRIGSWELDVKTKEVKASRVVI
ncbi:MAG TPA: PAS domain S-box protein, partial [Bacteroidetes bacterium]|nr:PAS domain S-box protein [Bacteroidota bacterium]